MMDEILVSFTEATRDVFKLMLDLDAKSEIHCITEGTCEQLNIAVGITGDIQGEIQYWFPKETVFEIVKIMSGMETIEIDDFVKSAIGEVANIISGNAMNNLYERNFLCDIKPPEVNFIIPPVYCQGADRTMVVTDIGMFNLDLIKKTVKF
ncbi:MAG: chemotaxis protein CheX [Eubacteriales bacterium]